MSTTPGHGPQNTASQQAASQQGAPRETLYASVPPADSAPLTWGQFRWYMQGHQHARDAVMYGIVGLISLGIVFGPLALIEAKKAQAYGVDAKAGRVLGWVAIGLFALAILFVLLYMMLVFAVVIPAIEHAPRSTGSYS